MMVKQVILNEEEGVTNPFLQGYCGVGSLNPTPNAIKKLFKKF